MSREYLCDPGLEFTGLLGPSPTRVWFLYCHHHKMRSIRWRHLRQSLSLLKNFQLKLYIYIYISWCEVAYLIQLCVFLVQYFKWKKHGKQQLLEFLESKSILIFLHGWEASLSHHVLHTAKHLKNRCLWVVECWGVYLLFPQKTLEMSPQCHPFWGLPGED